MRMVEMAYAYWRQVSGLTCGKRFARGQPAKSYINQCTAMTVFKHMEITTLRMKYHGKAAPGRMHQHLPAAW
jgi:hypothetical protein